VGVRQRPVEGLDVNPAYWQGKRVFVTGVTGFKGAWLGLWLEQMGAQVCGYSLPPPTSPSLFERARMQDDGHWIEADIRDVARLTREIGDWKPEVVFHLAAQSLVRVSYGKPLETFETNVMGTANLLEAARATPSVRAVVVVTTDKCYENREWVWPYREVDALGGHDPYSASKACAELVTASYRQALFGSKGAAIATARAGNVIGGADWATDRLVPDIVSAIVGRRTAAIRNPASVRPWQHVLEPLSGYLTLAEHLLTQGHAFGEAWNFGPSADSIQSVSTVANELCTAWGGEASWTHDASQHPHEAGILALDSSKARGRLGWRPRLEYRDAIRWTVEWYKAFHAGGDARALTLDQIRRYEELS
jgi:CDP-glucose 4,6-dehydratase